MCRLFTDFSYAYNVLSQVIPYLDVSDVIACSRVCNVWWSVVKQDRIWNKYKLKCCGTHIKYGVPMGLEGFVHWMEISKTTLSEKEEFLRLINNSHQIRDLLLFDVPVDFLEKVNRDWTNLEHFRMKQNNSDSLSVFQGYDIYKYATNLTKLHLEVNYPILLDDLSVLKQLKHLYVDADFRKGFFGPEHKYLQNLRSFGVGYYNYKQNPGCITLFNTKLSTLLTNNLKNILELQLGYLENDFLILAAVSRHPKLKHLKLVLVNTWNHYSFFLKMCTNLKKLHITSCWPQEKIASITEIATHNNILLASVKPLKNTLSCFSWSFDQSYMTESEVKTAVKNNEWRAMYTVIWENTIDFNPDVLNRKQIKEFAKNMCHKDLSLKELEEVVSKELPNVQVSVTTNKYDERCIFCPVPTSASVSMVLLKLLRRDRHKITRIQSRVRHLPVNRIRR